MQNLFFFVDKQHPRHEEADRMQRFLARDAEIEAHNVRYAAGQESFSRQHTPYSDLSEEEIDRAAFGLADDDEADDEVEDVEELPRLRLTAKRVLPTNFSFKDYKIMTPAKDQALCGCCYAFAANGMLEAQIAWARNGTRYDISEQSAVDCTYKRYKNQNAGCRSGSPRLVLRFYNETGIVDEKLYPYVSGHAKRRNPRCLRIVPGGNVKGRLVIRHRRNLTEEKMAEILYDMGPAVVAIAADGDYKNAVIDYSGGVLDFNRTDTYTPNHAVVLVGYGVENNVPYWLIKNSWGKSWGHRGYGKLRRGKNLLNIRQFGVLYVNIKE